MKIFKSSILLICLFAFPNIVLSQNKVIDSLENQLLVNKQRDTTRANNLDHLAFLYYRKDIDKAIDYLNRAEALAKELNFARGIANAEYTKGVIAMAQSNFDMAIKHYEKAAQLYNEMGRKKSVTGCYNGIGVICSYRGDYEKSTEYYKKALEIEREVGVKRNIPNYITNIGINQTKTGKYKEAIVSFKNALELFTEDNHTQGIATCLKNIAVVYQNLGNYPLALEHDKKSLSLAEKLQDSIGISNSLSNIGIIYKIQGNYDKALELFNKSLAIQKNVKNERVIAGIKNNIASIYKKKDKYSTAIKYLEESIEINRRLNLKSQLIESLNNLGYIYVSLKKYNKANDCYQEAKNISKDINYPEGLSLSYLGIADNYIQQEKYNKALSNVLKSLEISNKLNQIDHKKDAYKFLSEIYSNNGEYKKAYTNHKQFKKLNDSVFNKENIEKITQLEYEYKYKQALDSASIRELKLTKTVMATSQDLEKSQQNLLVGVIIFLTVALLLGSIIFFLKLRHAKSKTQNAVIEQKLLRSQMTPHFIFNSLSVLQGMILNKEEKNAVTYLSKFSKLLRATLENSRHKTVVLSDELSAINEYLALQNLDVNPPFNYTLNVASNIDTDAYKIPPMLIQPFIENAIEHAFPDKKEDKKITVDIVLKDKKMVCTISDNGIGYNLDKQNNQNNKNSLATTITSERLKMLSKDFNSEGAINIVNRETFGEQGTFVTLVIPYKNETA